MALFNRPKTNLAILEPLKAKAKARWNQFRQSPLGLRLDPLIERGRKLGLVASTIRFVMIIGDEGATLVQFRGRHILDALFVGPESEEGPEAFRDFLSADPSAQLLVSADLLEQMYREDTMPKVSPFDRATIVKRRLDLAYPNDPLRAALRVEKGKGGGDIFLFTALPVTPGLEPWIAFLESLPNPIVAFCMLPLESVGVGARLAPPIGPEETRKVWRALVTQQATSGFRQIFESERRLVVTRLTQRPPGDMTAEAIALLIERELRSSISYIKRLGYSDFDRLDFVAIASPDVCEAVSQRSLPVTSQTVLTPREASERLGYEPIGPEDNPFADAVHAQVLAAKRHPDTYLPTAKIRERIRHHQAFKGGFAAAAVLTVLAIFYIGSFIFDDIDALSTARVLAEQIATEQKSLALVEKKVAAFEMPADDLLFVKQSEDGFRKDQINPLDLFQAIGASLPPQVRVRKIAYTVPRLTAQAPARPTSPSAAPHLGLGALSGHKDRESAYEIELTVTFLGQAANQSDIALQTAKDLVDKLEAALPGNEVSVVQLPASQFTVQVIEGTAGASQSGTTAAPTAQYLIRRKA